jgi:hypothetical protein
MKRLLIVSLLVSGWMMSLYPGDPPSSDTTESYFEDLTHLLSLRLFTLTKSNTLEIINEPNGRIVLRPNGNTSLGVGVNYRFLGLALSFGLPQSQSSIEKYGQTRIFDVQVSSFGKRIGFDGFLQGYKGYYMANPQDHLEWDKPYYPQTSDLQITSFGAQAFYMFNSKQFSYKAAYLRTMVQKRSAGSFSAGIFFYQDIVKSDNGFVPQEISDSVWADFDLKEFDAFSIGISAGYQYTFVIKGNFFLSLQGTPGMGFRRLSGSSVNGDLGIVDQLAGQFMARAAIGYEFKHFYVGATASTILRSFKYKNYVVDLGTEQFRVMIGKRFDVNRKKL